MKVSVAGGQMSFENLTAALDQKKYAVSKAVIWLNMLNDNMKPTKWLKASKKGTKVNFDSIRSEEDYKSGLDELDSYLYEINKKFGTDLKINYAK